MMENISIDGPKNPPSAWEKAYNDHLINIEDRVRMNIDSFDFQVTGFDINEELLKRQKGLMFDVGGPSCLRQGYDFDRSKLGIIWNTNITKSAYPSAVEKVDFQADAKKLPLASGSADVIFSQGFFGVIGNEGNEIWPDIYRVLADEGLYFLHATNFEGVKKAESFGFDVKAISNIDHTDPGDIYIVILQKPKKTESVP